MPSLTTVEGLALLPHRTPSLVAWMTCSKLSPPENASISDAASVYHISGTFVYPRLACRNATPRTTYSLVTEVCPNVIAQAHFRDTALLPIVHGQRMLPSFSQYALSSADELPEEGMGSVRSRKELGMELHTHHEGMVCQLRDLH